MGFFFYVCAVKGMPGMCSVHGLVARGLGKRCTRAPVRFVGAAVFDLFYWGESGFGRIERWVGMYFGGSYRFLQEGLVIGAAR